MARPPLIPQLAEQIEPSPPPFEYYVPFPSRAIYDESITDFDRRVLLGVIQACQKDGPRSLECDLSNQELAAQLSCSEQAVRITLGRLSEAGYLRRVTDKMVKGTGRRIELLYRTWEAAPSGSIGVEFGEQANPRARPRPRGGRALDHGGGAPCTTGGARPRPRGGRALQSAPILLEKKEEKTLTLAAPGNEDGAQTEANPCSGHANTGRETAPALAESPSAPSPEEIALWESQAKLPGIRGKVARRQLEMLAEPPPVLRAVAKRPPPATPPAVAPRHIETVDLLRRLAEPAGPEAVEEAARRLAAKFGDEHSLAFYRGVCSRAASGELNLRTLLSAFRQATSGTCRRPGAVFTAGVGGESTRMKKPAVGLSTKAPDGRLRLSAAIPTEQHYTMTRRSGQ